MSSPSQGRTSGQLLTFTNTVSALSRECGHSFFQLASEASSYQTPYFIQDCPRRLRPPPSHSLVSVACDTRGVHALYMTQSQLRFVLFNLDSGKFYQTSQFSELSSKYLVKQGIPLQLMPISFSLGNYLGILIDKHGGLFPISKNNIGNIRDLQLLVRLINSVVIHSLCMVFLCKY